MEIAAAWFPLDFLDVSKRRVLPGCVVGVLGGHICSGSLREDALCVCMLVLVGGKIGESSGRRRCGHRTKSLKLLVTRGRVVDLPLPELRFGQHQVSLCGRRIDR